VSKKTKQETHYRPGKPGRRCANCEYMNQDGTCDKVEGLVTPPMVCDLWEKA